MSRLAEACRRPWTGRYLRFLAVAIGYGGLVHAANILGYGERPWLETPLAWRLGDVAYGVLDAVDAVGLWARRPWGVALFLLLIASQVLLYTAPLGIFRFDEQQRQIVHGLLLTEGALVAGLLLLVAWKK